VICSELIEVLHKIGVCKISGRGEDLRDSFGASQLQRQVVRGAVSRTLAHAGQPDSRPFAALRQCHVAYARENRAETCSNTIDYL